MALNAFFACRFTRENTACAALCAPSKKKEIFFQKKDLNPVEISIPICYHHNAFAGDISIKNLRAAAWPGKRNNGTEKAYANECRYDMAASITHTSGKDQHSRIPGHDKAHHRRGL
jgi:hypothetical protein